MKRQVNRLQQFAALVVQAAHGMVWDANDGNTGWWVPVANEPDVLWNGFWWNEFSDLK